MQEKSSEKILAFLKQEPSLSAKALAEKMHLTSRVVEKQIGLLKQTGKLRRNGPSKADTGPFLTSRPHHSIGYYRTTYSAE